MKQPPASHPNAYSYVRWSSPQQAAGDSLRRQLERATQYAESHGLVLVEDQRWEDQGKSAYRGRNWHEGALGAFVKAVDSGDIPRGSFLLVEALDRISRDHVLPALNRMQEITQRGITIVTLMDGRLWDSDSLKDTANLFYLVGMFSTANIESRNKQDRSLAYWRRKRQKAVEDGVAPTRTCPLWLAVGDDGRYHAIPERAEVVRRIYQLSLDGMGARRIARRLNDSGIPKFTDPSRPKATDSAGWSGSYVHQVLTTDATIGVWRGHRLATPEEGDFVRRREADPQNGLAEDGSVYPAIIEKDVWLRVQEKVKGRNGNKRPPGKPVGQAALTMANLFTGLCRCSCGAGMRYHLAGPHARPKLVCSAHLQGNKSSCVIKRWDYKSVEVFLLYALAEGELLNHAQLFPGAVTDAAEAAVAALERERDQTTADLRLASEGADRIVSAIL